MVPKVVEPFWKILAAKYIDQEMVHFKLHFFLLSGAFGAVLPFVGVFAKTRLRLSATSFATIMTAQQFLFVFTKPALGFLTDYFNKLKVVLLVLVIAESGFLFLLLLVPPLPKGLANGPNIVSSMQSFDAFHLCSNARDSYYISKASVYEGDLTNNTYVKRVNRKCNVVEDASSTDLDEYVHVSVSKEFHPFMNRPSNKLIRDHSNIPHSTFLETDFVSFSNRSSVQFATCDKISNGSCAAFLDGCLLCCSCMKGCYFVRNPLDETQFDSQTATEDISSGNDFATYQFWVFAVLFVALNACINSIFTLSDTACCESVEKIGGDFGKQRLWGCVGWGIFSPLGGLLTDLTGNYLATWILFVVLSSLALWNITKLDLMKLHISKDILKDIGTVVSSWEFLRFEIGALLSGIGLGFTFFYLLWFITSIGGSSFLCGLIQTVQSFSGDIPFMFFSGWMLRKLGYFNIVTLSLLACCVRFLWYSQLENAWWVLPIEWTHGITYGVFYAAIASFAKRSAKPGTEATTQSVIFATFDGLGSGIGNIVAGVGFDYLGGHAMFLISGIFFGCAAVLNMAFTFFHRNDKKRPKNYNRLG